MHGTPELGTTATADTQLALETALRHGTALQQEGRHAEAESLYRRLMDRHPADPTLLQLLGLAVKAQGRMIEAEELLRRSLALHGEQPHVWNNLGNLLLGCRRYAEAAAAYHEAARLKDDFAGAWDGLGRALLALKDLDGAQAAFQRALELTPAQPSPQVGLAEIAAKRDEDDEAERRLRLVLDRHPGHAIALHRLGESLSRRGRAVDAEPFLRKAATLLPAQAEMHSSLGYALQLKGDYDPAIASYREALARDPLHVPTYVSLARLLWELERKEEYIADLDAALARFPHIPALHIVKGDLLAFIGSCAAAREAFEQAAHLDPRNPLAADGVARMATELKDRRSAIEQHVRAVALAGPISVMRASYGYSLLQLGEADAAIAVLDDALQYDRFDQAALSSLTLALRAAGDPREHWLADYERLAQPLEVPPPAGWPDMAAFNAELNASIDALHDSDVEPAARTLRHGTQTLGRLFGRGIELVDRLRERLDETIQRYVQSLPEDERHPFLCRKAARFRYRGSWSVRLKDAGYHVNHFHPKGWISSAYYVSVPDAVGDAEAKQGWFTLGAPPFDMDWPEPARRQIQPRAGMLVLFPSYFYHGVVPFRSSQSRTTIAFDAVPVS